MGYWIGLLVFLGVVSACQTPGGGEEARKSSFASSARLAAQSQNSEGKKPYESSAEATKINAYQAYLQAEMLSSRGEMELALELLEYAYRLDGNSFLATKFFATLIIAQKFARVEELAPQLVERHPQVAALHFLYGNLLVEKKQFTAAITQFNFCLDEEKFAELAYLQLVSIYELTENIPQALKTADKMHRRFPRSSTPLLKLSHLYLGQGQQSKAFKALAEAYKLQPEQEDIALRHAFALDFSNKNREAVQVYLKVLGHTFDLSRLQGQVTILVRMLGNNPGYFSQLFARLQAESSADQQLGLHVLRCFLFLEIKHDEQVGEDLQALEKAKGSYAVLDILLGLAYERLGNIPAAERQYKEISPDDKNYLLANQRLIQLKIFTGSAAEALQIALSLLDYPFADWETYITAATVYGSLRRFTEGIGVLEQGMSKYPHKVKLLYMKGVLQEKAGQTPACIATMEEVIKRDKSFDSAYNFLGYLYAESGQKLDEAEKLIVYALTLKPDDGFYLDSLGMVYYQRGNYEEALRIFLQAATLQPEEGVVLEHVGDCYQRLGKADLARDCYQLALKKNLEEKDQLRINGKLSNVQI